MLKVLAAAQYSTKKDGGVHRRDLRVQTRSPVLMLASDRRTPVVRQLLPEKAQRSQNALAGRGSGDEAAFFSNAEGGQAKARGCDAGHHPSSLVARTLHRSFTMPVLDWPDPKNREVGVLHIIKKTVVVRGERGRTRDFGGWLSRLRQGCCGSEKIGERHTQTHA